jgi:hypothetical protein
MTTIIDGTAGITFPVTAGSASAVQASSGRVLQVVNATFGTSITTTSTTYVDTGLTASITPSSSTNKILVLVDMADVGKSGGTGTGGYGTINIVRNSTQLIQISRQFAYTGNTNSNSIGSVSSNYLDAPATTSPTTYKIQYALAGSNGTMEINASNGTSTITLMEIAA